MQYPLISEYIDAIRLAADNFDKLSHLQPVLDGNGTPMMSSGNFAVVFKMHDPQAHKDVAVKCFLKEQEGRAESYQLIAQELAYTSSSFLTPFRYLDKEIFVESQSTNDEEFPVVLMDWVEGETLDRYIQSHLADPNALRLLAFQFSRLASWLLSQPFAHGDLKPDNILVRSDGTLTLVDYDGMFVPAMEGTAARELGSPDFRHPLRTAERFNEHIDDFPLAVILLSLKALSLSPSLWNTYGASDRLLFSAADYRALSSCAVLQAFPPLFTDSELTRLYALFLLAHSEEGLSNVSFRLLNLKYPELVNEEEVLSTKATDEDLAEGVEDVFGKYCKEANDALKSLLTVFLERKVHHVVVKNSEMVKDYSKMKNPRLDLLVEFDDRTTVDLEMQLRQTKDNLPIRFSYYLARLHGSQELEGKYYGELKETIVLVFFNVNLIDNNRMCNTFTLKNEDGLSFVKETEDRMKIRTVEMAKLDVNKPLEEMNEQEKMIYYFLNCHKGIEDSKIKVMIENDEVIQMLEKRVETISDDGWKKIIEDFRKLHENEERMERQLELEEAHKAKEEAKKVLQEANKLKQEANKQVEEANKQVEEADKKVEKANKQVKQMVCKMYEDGFSLEQISAYCSLNVDEIQVLIKS